MDIEIYNVMLKDSPSWTLHLANTTNVQVHDMQITAPTSSHNTDGIDIDCSVNVLVENVYYAGGNAKINVAKIFFVLGDDFIAVKSGIDWLGRTYGRTTENVLVKNCTVGSTHGI